MTSVWKRLQRVNKRAAKFEFTASYHRVDLETTSKWKPNKLSIVWSRRSRRVVSEALEWEPSMKEPLRGSIMWAVPDNHTIAVTLFRDQRTNELEDKDWIFILEDVSTTGRRRRVAQVPLNLKPLASVGPSQQSMVLPMRPCTTKVTSASLEVTVSSVLLREGSAADEDMQSMASMMSANNNSDIGHLDDFEDEDISFSENSTSLKQSAAFGYRLPSDKKMLDLTQQMELMTSSLAGTPGSAASLSVTPVASTPLDSGFDNPNRDSFKLPSLPYDDNKYKNLFDGAQFATVKPASKDNLKPLEFKTNLNDYQYSKDVEEDNSNVTTPIVENSKIRVERTISFDDNEKFKRELSVEDTSNKDVTPAHDLLEWCKEITKDYTQCNITNMTTSWSNGIAFCAIIHYFRPDLIDMLEVSPNDPEGNIRMALKASETLGVPIVLHPSEIRRARGPDRLALLTYLHQLRALFTNRQFRLSKIGQTAEESSYTVGRFNTDKDTNISVELFSQEILSMRKKSDSRPATNRTSLSSQDSMDSQHSQEKQSVRNINSPDKILNSDNQPKDKSPMNNMMNILGKVLSPTKEKLQNLKSSFDNSKFSNKDVIEASSNNKSYVINKDLLLSKDFKKETELNKQDVKEKKDSSFIQPLDITVREAWPVKLMTRKQLTDPFGSDEEDDTPDPSKANVLGDISKSSSEVISQNDNSTKINDSDQFNQNVDSLSSVDLLPKPTQQLLSRHDKLKERTRQLLEATRKEAREESVKVLPAPPTNVNGVKVQKGTSNPQKLSEEARQAQLRERARKLIADARAGLTTSPTSPSGRIGTIEVLSASHILAEQQLKSDDMSSPKRNSNDNSPPEKVDDLLKSNVDAENNAIDTRVMDETVRSPLQRSFEGGVKKSSSPLRSFTNIMERISPDKDSFIMKGFGKDMRNYIQSELEALEREQSAIDKQATILEKEVRMVMESGQSEEEENALLAKWFTLVNKKNALLKRQMQLNILEQENELRARHAKVDEELRALMTVEEWRKSEGQRGDEARLLRELLNVVDARDQIVHLLHEHEQALEDDDEIERNLSNVELKKKNNCFIQ